MQVTQQNLNIFCKGNQTNLSIDLDEQRYSNGFIENLKQIPTDGTLEMWFSENYDEVAIFYVCEIDGKQTPFFTQSV